MLTSDLKTPPGSEKKERDSLKETSSPPLPKKNFSFVPPPPYVLERRDFLLMTTCAIGGVGALGFLWPFFQSLAPAADIEALSTVDVDLSPIPEGEGITVLWRGSPIFIRHRTPQEIEEARKTPMSSLLDPAKDQDRVKPHQEAWLVVFGVCTHLGCVPVGQKPFQNRGEWGGWFCPCHGSEYDTSGRVRRGPAPTNLPIPPYRFLDEKTLRIGQGDLA